MPQSMTAFARAIKQLPWGTITWEIRSLNHRYLEVGFRLPDTQRNQEIAFREAARKLINRGKLDCTLQLSLNRDQQGVAINSALAHRYLEATAQIAALIPQAAPISPMDILRWPGVLEESVVDSEELSASVLDLFGECLEQLVDNRTREGDQLGELILQRIHAIREETAKVRASLPQILSAQKQKLIDRIAELAVQVDPDRLEQEVVLLAQKADVDEELDRIDVHIGEISRVLKNRGPIGRRLDFFMQELNREANTLSSKSIATDTTQSAVELKVLIEQMREQIQNIE